MREVLSPAKESAKFNPQIALDTLDIEIAAVQALRQRLANTPNSLKTAVELILQTKGRVVVMGMGKSGHIGRKIAASLASTGTPAMFVHPAEAGHGDLGMVTEHDIVLALSNSGEVDEITTLLPLIKRIGIALIAMTGGLDSSLAKHADVLLDTHVEKEACPLNLAPTASAMTQLACGDALAMSLLDARGFKTEDFARSHPGGSLGRKLLMHVRDLMRSGLDIPRVRSEASLMDLMQEMSRKGLGASAVIDAKEQVLGIFTDGDLRRLIEQGLPNQDLRRMQALDVMKRNPRCIHADALAVEAVQMMEEHRITSVLVVDADGVLIGALNSNDLMRAKVI